MENTYLFNPFIVNGTEEEIANTYHKLQSKILDNCNAPSEYANNIETYANMNYLVGEMIARLTFEYSTLKTEIKIRESKNIYLTRKQWLELETDKPPAMSYFEALATESVKNDLIKLAELESKLKRFKNAYDSIQDKSNAIKKQMEALKYEIGIGE